MLYCPRCNKNVEFNSVSSSRVTGAYKMDLDGPIDPTYVRTQQQITNVCKICGCNNLSRSKAEHLQKCQRQKEMDDFDPIAKAIGIIFAIILFIILVASQ